MSAGNAAGQVPILAARGVSRRFGAVMAVEDASIELYPGRITALVGESGSGKTTLARMLALFYPPTSGQILLNGTEVKPKGTRRDYYGQVQMIFQDPFSSLNSLKRVRHVLGRPLRIHGKASGRRDAEAKMIELLERVSLTPGKAFLDRYPSELSGGQRQRIAIARALSVEPCVLLADEPTSMLDASIRLGMLNLLKRLRDEEDVAILYITHDIASARYLSDELNVMYRGRLVERGPTEQVISSPDKHDYTRLLLSSAPDPSRYKRGVTHPEEVR